MVRIVLKEIFITLLICIAILLILGIIFYDYNPINKVIPNKIEYATTNEIKKEIGEGKIEDILEGSFNVVYSIDNSDLEKYKKSERYVPGKEHPFSDIEKSVGDTIPGMYVETVNGVEEETADKSADAPTTVKTPTTNPDSTGTFLNTAGKK